MLLEATFDIASWEESTVEEWEGGKLTRARVAKRYSGDLAGEATLEYLLSYGPDGTATFVGLERVTGEAAGASGALVLQQVGTFADGAAKATLTVVGGSGELVGARGGGELIADPSGRVSLDLTTS